MNKKILIAAILVVIFAIVSIFVFSKNNIGNSQTSTTKQNNAVYSLTQISQHNSASSCWMIISGNVYDVTAYIPQHPNNQILQGCGKDATDLFNSVGKHQGRATSMLSDYLIGTLSN